MRSLSPRRIRIRPLTRHDQDVVTAVFAGLSPASRALRFLTPVAELTPAMVDALVDVAPDRHVALVAETRTGRSVGIARYLVDGPAQAEVAYEVVDDWHGRGIGTRLLRALVEHADRNGVARLHASLRSDNHASLSLLRRVLPQLRVVDAGGLLEVSAALDTSPFDLSDVLADLHVA
jgi:L-amino acid N-acyltransferase YncA